mgnify:CR=1 FL=1
MSRIGKQPIVIPDGVTVAVQGTKVTVKGKKGEGTVALPPKIKASVADGKVLIAAVDDSPLAKSCWGLARTLVANMVAGVVAGYSRELELQGVGFRAAVQGQKLTMTLGFSSPVEFIAAPGIAVQVKDAFITVSGIDKQLVGDTAARIRSVYPPEPYKGKGIRYKGEAVRRKAGKTVA